jgi:AbrB family looped-hinge helix DNA binding protein
MVTSSTYTQKVKSQGRNCIPKIVREALGISEGDPVTFTVQKTMEA